MLEYTFSPAHSETWSPAALEETVYGTLTQASAELFPYLDSDSPPMYGAQLYQPEEALHALLTADGLKRGVSIDADTFDHDAVFPFVEALNALGLDCWVDTDTVATVDNAPVYRHMVHATADRSYREHTPPVLSDDADATSIGRFYGYPEADVHSYVENGLNGNQVRDENGVWRLARYDPDEEVNMSPWLFARETGREDAVPFLRTLIPYTIRNDTAVLEDTIHTAQERYQRLEELEAAYGVPLTGLVGQDRILGDTTDTQ